jgi:hypothetical protein
MNGRIYDPVIGRFFSPDKYVANSSFTQDFHRYSYARNNPLMYTDPSGESIIGLLVTMFVTGFINMAMNGNNIQHDWQALAYFGIGALAGAAGAGAGAGISSVMSIGGFGGGFISGVTGGLAGAFVTGAGNAWTQGASFGQGFLAGIGSGVKGGVIGGAIGGITGGLKAKMAGADFWDGYFESKLTAGTTAKPTVQQKLMATEYNKHSAGDDFTFRDKADRFFNFREGDLGFHSSTNVPEGWGLHFEGKYIDPKGGIALGVIRGYLDKPWTYSMHISPYVVGSDDVFFRAIVGHELIHAYHYSIFGTDYVSLYSEASAYRYSYETFSNAGRASDFYKGNEWYLKVSYPPSYGWPFLHLRAH